MTRLPAPGWIAAALVALLATPNGPPRTASNEPEWWDIALTIEVKGEYRMEVRNTRALGAFAFAFAWSGTLQKDDEDYLLIHRACHLTRWNIEEKTSFAEAITTLSTADIMDKPELKVNYILKKADGLHLNFEIAGFDVPKLTSAESFYLRLPVSEENAGILAGVDYDLFVKSGSNRIIVDEKPIEQGPLTRKFFWSWRCQNWVQRLDSTVFQSSGHDATLTLSITPQKEFKGRAFDSPLIRGLHPRTSTAAVNLRTKAGDPAAVGRAFRPGDGTCRRPASAGRG